MVSTLNARSELPMQSVVGECKSGLLGNGVLADFIVAVGRCKDAPHAARQSDLFFGKMFGHKLFTLTVLMAGGDQVRRLYSSGQSDYAIGGSKPVLDNAWSRQVMVEGRPFVGNTIVDVIPYFPDYKTISDMGLGGIMNLPVLFEGKSIGTVNLLDHDYAYDENKAKQAHIFAQVLNPIFVNYRLSGDHSGSVKM